MSKERERERERERESERERWKKERRSYDICNMLQCYANIHNIVACCKSEMQNAIQDESCFLCIFVNIIICKDKIRIPGPKC